MICWTRSHGSASGTLHSPEGNGWSATLKLAERHPARNPLKLTLIDRRIDTTVSCPRTDGTCTLRSMADGRTKNAYTIHLCKQGEEFQKVLDFAGLFRPIVEAGIEGKWKILGVTSIGPREVFVDIEEVPASLA